MKDLIYYLLIVVALIVYLNLPYSSSPFNPTGSSSSSSGSINTVYIFYAPWCGYCKKSMDDFNQASNKNSKIRLINSDQNPDLVKKYNVKGFPTIIKSNGQIYSGDRSTSSILDFADS